MRENATVALPTLVSLVICDQVIDDRLTNKKSVIGLFNTVLVHTLPTRIQQVVVMASLTEITARTPLELRLVRDSDNAVMMATQGFVDAPNPLATVDLIFAMQGVQVATPGQYAFELISGGEPLGRRRFQVVTGQRPAAEENQVPPAGG